ncbi:hypothetical protein DI09_58p110 [Mitosporidium daphniae]|uniref:Inositol polyphosphate-related phosphatase domain-containing protein n=1 Tax=Mitosporidium daphniae TaxID=1485682 RepID=A0A098VPJ5_9MICR|nr:uncharacterized protein DI09_58p110 [Mitosporidium daphniae]KGG50739.1 hypothetical protein DI09_58p110 [Mitosporidium daphniae]|eukprot:XP_013237166.1 uncharacterized protein DI09_58p110 [Mitosporidium daphniae]
MIGSWNINSQNESSLSEITHWLKHMAFECQRVNPFEAENCLFDSSDSLSPSTPGGYSQQEKLTEYDILSGKGFLSNGEVDSHPDLIILGFQEWKATLHWEDPQVKKWIVQIEAALSITFIPNHLSRYCVVGSIQWMGFFLVIFQRTSYPKGNSLSVSVCRRAHFGTGPLFVGSKGAIGVQLSVSLKDANGDSLFEGDISVINAHFSANPNNIASRRSEYETIFHRLFLHGKGDDALSDARITSTSIAFFFGDFNYRLSDKNCLFDQNMETTARNPDETQIDISPLIQMSPSLGPFPSSFPISPIPLNAEINGGSHKSEWRNIPQWLKDKNWPALLAFDQLTFDRISRYSFSEFDEARITFPPTYKYIPGSNHLDIIDKSVHIPSWCDRILYYSSGANTIQPEVYTSTPFIISSDHKPIFGLYAIRSKQLKAEKECRESINPVDSSVRFLHLRMNRLLEYYERILRPDMLNLFNGYVSILSMDVSMVLDGGTAHNPNYKYKSALLLQLLTGKRPNATPCNVFREGTSEILFNGLSSNIYLSPSSPNSVKDEMSDNGRRSDKEKRALLLTKLNFASNAASGKKHAKNMMSADDYRKATSSHSGLKISCSLRNEAESFEFLDKLREFYLPDPSFQRLPTRNGLLTHSLDVHKIARDEMLGAFTRSNSFNPLSEDIIKRVKSKLRRKLIARHKFHERAFKSGDNPLSAKTTYVISPLDCLKFPDVEGHFDGLSDLFSAPNVNPFYIYIRPHLKVHFPLQLQEKTPETLVAMTYFLSAFFNPFSYRLRVPLALPNREERLELLRPTGLKAGAAALS